MCTCKPYTNKYLSLGFHSFFFEKIRPAKLWEIRGKRKDDQKVKPIDRIFGFQIRKWDTDFLEGTNSIKFALAILVHVK